MEASPACWVSQSDHTGALHGMPGHPPPMNPLEGGLHEEGM